FENEKPVFNAGVKLEGWIKEDSDLPNLPGIAAGNIWSIPIPDNIEAARFLFNDSGPLVNAVSDGLHTAEDENTFSNINTPPTREQLSSFVFPEGYFREWENLQDIEAVVRP